MNLLSILLQAAQTESPFGNWSGILMMVAIFVIFYFFMIRPQTKRQKEIRKQREAMKKGDKVITSGGIYGKVKDVKETTVTVEIAENVRVTVDKNSIFATAADIQTAEKK
ncbi:MAG: preprotein translocase subunit YajC [Paludibacter sp.]|nr:MAG: preprotein translocase subunit YajC [Paludibacter sp.]